MSTQKQEKCHEPDVALLQNPLSLVDIVPEVDRTVEVDH
jgi:hypothetical protein